MSTKLRSIFSKTAQSRTAQIMATPLRTAARFAARNSHLIMAIPYWSANISLYAGNFVQRAINDNYIDPSLLNPLNDFNTAAGAIAVIGGSLNLFQKKLPILFNAAGACVIINAGCILAKGLGEPALVERMIGTIPSITVGLMMLTDQRFKGADALTSANDNQPSSFKRTLSNRRRLIMGAYLSVSRVFLTVSAAGDMPLLTILLA